jgi:hypothetical protein
MIKQKDIGRVSGIGLGDVVESITKATGIKAVVDKVAEVTGKDCGCNKRKEKLNNLFTFNKSYNGGNNITGS